MVLPMLFTIMTRKKYKRCLFCVIFGVWLLAMYFLLDRNSFEVADPKIEDTSKFLNAYDTNYVQSKSIAFALNFSRDTKNYPIYNVSLNVLSLYQNLEKRNSSEKLKIYQNIVKLIEDYNNLQFLLNSEIFGANISNDHLVILIQVHNRVNYLRHLIASLRRTYMISKTVLIFSHDFFDTEINDLIASIDFALVLQILFPCPHQLFQYVFPGTDPKDCPRNVKRDQAVKLNCTNANTPDKFGHYREAKYTQIKHHWFWKLNMAFEQLSILKNFSGYVLLLEEDHYVIPDSILFVKKVISSKTIVCPTCDMITIGTYEKTFDYKLADQVAVNWWLSSKHNMGMVLNKNVWQKIKDCYINFCAFDDYNWDWSIQHIGLKCVNPPPKQQTGFRVINAMTSRIFHLGECGVHHKKTKICDPDGKVKGILSQLEQSQNYFFTPDQVHRSVKLIYPRRVVKRLIPKPNGGWADPRDHELCRSFISKNTSQTIFRIQKLTV